MRSLRSILLTGGAGFLGSSLARHLLLQEEVERLVVLDRLTHAGRRANLADIEGDPRFTFVEGDIADRPLVAHLLTSHRVTGVMNLAAESHSERSISSPDDFMATNVMGATNLLEVCRFTHTPLLHTSTGEVYGPIEAPGLSAEDAPCNPSTLYAASKAAADLMCLASHKAYGQDVVITRCTNAYGPRQHHEDFIPTIVRHAINDEDVPLPGHGMHIRDWIHATDYCRGMVSAFQRGGAGEVFNFSGWCERTNLGVVRNILEVLGKPATLIRHVEALPGQDLRFALDTTKALRYLGWRPEIAIQDTIGHLVRELAANFTAARRQGWG